MMLTFNGLTFTPLGQSLDQGSHGFYKATPGKGVHLYKPNGLLEAYIVNNMRQGQFVVSASEQDGQPRYMFSTSSLTEKWLDLHEKGSMHMRDAIEGMQILDRENLPTS